jgi:hypothetical protein
MAQSNIYDTLTSFSGSKIINVLKQSGSVPIGEESGNNDNSKIGIKNYFNNLAVHSNTKLLCTSINNPVPFNTASYYGGSYAPTLDRIYMSPDNNASNATWHYIDGATGAIVGYQHSSGITQSHRGSAYSTSNDRIYLIPSAQSSLDTWAYIDGATGTVVAYEHSAGTNPVAGAFIGGCYSPIEKRVYPSPYSQSNQATWFYIDCTNDTVVGVQHGLSAGATAYASGCYSPTENRIWFIPYTQSNQNTWHYVDCDTGTFVAYQHGASNVAATAYFGGTYAPTQNRIYMIPRGQSTNLTWHYVDCDTSSIKGIAVSGSLDISAQAYAGGAFHPLHNKIFLGPLVQSNNASKNWHYIDCNDGTVVEYQHTTAVPASTGYVGAAFSPTENRVYFIPYNQGNQSFLNIIEDFTKAGDISNKKIMSDAMFSNTL